MKRAFLFILTALISFNLYSGDYLTGTPVFAEWEENDWYHGKIDSSCADGYIVLFDDGDTKCCTPDRIVPDIIPSSDEIEIDTPVLALWDGWKFYPGTINTVNGKEYEIAYSDGDTGVASLEQLRVMDALPPATAISSTLVESEPEPLLDEPMQIWKDGSLWAEISESGTIWIDGSQVGGIEAGGDIYVDGSHAGKLTGSGYIWINGSQEGELDLQGRFWRSSSNVGSIIVNGDIYLHGSKWGEAQPIDASYFRSQVAAVVLAFFAQDFGFVE
ncbi:MAG: hypothetical protein DRZ90_02040 [Spirochaetes bacterium]|nr:MAG: hypothetical protein DRP60_06210 [Spirochaetota bacterium]RKX98649.1 MAG: hypothetical protein DRZ90_02040 [Spirochaetota bacterium]